MSRVVFSIGHSTQAQAELFERLERNGVKALADVRAYPASRRHPHFAREALESACRACGIEYRWLPGLGGRRRAAKRPTRHTAWREDGFRNYADYMDGAEFAAARADLEQLAAAKPTAFLCAEGLWWQCHRRLLADSLSVAGWDVRHILPSGTLAEHRLPDFARVEDGRIVYDRGVTEDLDLGSERRRAMLPSLDDPHPLPPDAAESFRRDGFAVVRGLATPDEVAAFRPAIVETAGRLRWDLRPLEERDTYGKAFLQTVNLWRHEEAVARFVFARRFARAAAELLAVAGVRLYHDQALFKEAGGGPTPWHQDQYYWPLDTDRTITLWMPLRDLVPADGIMHFARGSHAGGCFADLPIGDESEERLSRFVRERGFEVTGATSMRAGDATFHSGWTLHGAPANLSGVLREVMTIIYFADGASVLEPDNPGRRFDLKMWLPGLAAGDLAASEINPLLYASR